MNARDKTPLRTLIADRLAAGEDTAAGIASAIGKGDTPSIVVKELNAMRRRSPILDPITAAMLGYTRRGTGWVKKNAVSPSQEAMK